MEERWNMGSIIFFIHDLSLTGVAGSTLGLARHLAKANWDVEIVTVTATGIERGGALSVTPLQPAHSGNRAATLRNVLPALRRHLRRRRPDIVFSAGNHAHLACWAATRGLATKLVYRISNDPRMRGVGAPQRQFTRFARQVKFTLLANGADRLVLVSPHLSEIPVLARALVRGRATIITNGVDLERARAGMLAPCPHPWLHDDGPPVVLAIGRLAEQKNFPTLIDAVARANTVRPHRLIILGDGAAKHRAGLLALAERRNIADMVNLPGTDPNPFAYLARARLFVLPSWREGASNVLLEALACGVPVVASRTAGNARGVLDEGRHGVLVDPGDAAGMADAILRQSDPRTALRPGERARAFTIEQTHAAYTDMLNGLQDKQLETLPAKTLDSALAG
jgi:glycosyltransferase involved in cell wall biosynthesis